MSLLATGVVVGRQTIYAAIWVNGAGRALGGFPNTPAGVEQLVERLGVLADAAGIQGVHLLLEPQGGAELPLLAAADAQEWPISLPDPTRLASWAGGLGYGGREGAAGALQLARYAAAISPPRRAELPPEVAALSQRLLAQGVPLPQLAEGPPTLRQQAPLPADELLRHDPALADKARTLRRLPGIGAANLLPLLVLLHRWRPAANGGLALDALPAPAPAFGSLLWERLRALHPAAYLAIAVVLLLRLVRLDTLPSDLYGDIAIIISYVANIFDGQWPAYFDLSAGPLYHYLIAPLLWLTGLTYYGIKLASVITSLLTLAVTYALARDLVDAEFGLFAFFCAGVSCWFLVFSRLGNSQILVPLLAVASLYLALRGVRRKQTDALVASALVAVGGLYTYPQSFIIPGVTGLALLWLVWREPQRPWRALLVYGGVCLLGALPFVAIIYRDLDAFLSGYVGDKLPVGTEWGAVLRENAWNTLLALHVRGDHTFRSNPVDLPLLDPVSGLLFLVGLVFWLLPRQRPYAPLVLIPLVLLQLPAMLVRYTVEVPSASRTLGALPFVALVVAGGLWWPLTFLRRWPQARYALVYGLLGLMLLLNSYRYFVDYAQGLPNGNIAYGRVIADYIDTLPAERHVLLIGCCWGEAGQPHPFAVLYDVDPARYVVHRPADQVTCEELAAQPRPMTIIWGLKDGPPAPQLAPCTDTLSRTLHRAPSGEPVFFSAELGQ